MSILDTVEPVLSSASTDCYTKTNSAAWQKGIVMDKIEAIGASIHQEQCAKLRAEMDQSELIRLRALTQQQAEQIAELVEYAKGLRREIEDALNKNYEGKPFGCAQSLRAALAKPMPKAMKEEE
jgi:predicted 2-oxoglutarate/Fe(II)-dependent dioxygenase YbiX